MKFAIYLLALCTACASTASAEEWRYRSNDVSEIRIRDQGLLARSGPGFLQISGSWALRRDATGQVLDRMRLDSSLASDSRLLVLPDLGWLILARFNYTYCEISRFDARGQRLWRSPTTRSSCEDVSLYTDAAGGWLVSNASQDYAARLQRLRADGEWVPLNLSAAGLQPIEVLAQREDGSFDLALIGGSQGISHARLIGDRVEQIRQIEPSAQPLGNSAISSDGSLWLIAKGVDGDPAESLLRFDAQGRRQWRLALNWEAGRRLQGLRPIEEGVVGVVSSALDLSQGQLLTVDQQGREVARVGIEGRLWLYPVLGQTTLRPAPSIGAITLGLELEGAGATIRSYNARGAIVATPLEHGGRSATDEWAEVRVPAGNSALLAAHSISSTHVDVVFGTLGARVRSLDLGSRKPADLDLSDSASFGRGYPIAIAGNDTRVCVGPTSVRQFFEYVQSFLSCADRTSGQVIYRTHVWDPLEGVGSLVGLTPTSVLALDAQQQASTLVFAQKDQNSRQLARLRVSSDGRRGDLVPLASLPASIATSGLYPSSWRASIQADGSAVFAYPHPQGGLGLVQANATNAVVQMRLAANETVAPKAVLDRGAAGVALLVDVSGASWARNELWLVDASGRLQHRLELGAGKVESSGAVMLEVGGRLLLARDAESDIVPAPPFNSPAARTTRSRMIGLVDPLTGSWLWQRSERRVLGDRLVDLKLDAASGGAVLLANRSGQPRIERLDLATGDSLDVRSLRCPDSRSCLARGMSIDGHGQGRLLAEANDEQLGWQMEVVSFDLGEPPVRPGVAGLSGLWFAPESGGQGLVLSMMPNANALLGGWFTYTEDGGNRAADQRWYALETNYAAGATHLSIDLLRSAGGTFAVDVPSVPEIIGHGELYLRSCSEAVFRYRFTAGEESGLAGEIPLLRLGPGSSDCGAPPAQLADGGGFSVRQSGAWYKPEQGGQGLVMEVLPPAPGSPGLFSAGWFTFDPQGAANDPHTQHWFWIQGDIPVGASGEVDLPIFNAIGGSLDTGITHNVREVGRARIRFTACDRVELDYRFDAQAGAFAQRAGRLQLSRLSGCASP